MFKSSIQIGWILFENRRDITKKDRKIDVYCSNCGLENTVTIKAGNNKYWSCNIAECWNCDESLRQS